MRSITGTPSVGLEVALLARRELVVAGDEVRVGTGKRGLELFHLAGSEVGVRVRLLAALDEFADVRHARRAQQLPQLAEVPGLTVGQRGDHERTLACATSRAVPVDAV